MKIFRLLCYPGKFIALICQYIPFNLLREGVKSVLDSPDEFINLFWIPVMILLYNAY